MTKRKTSFWCINRIWPILNWCLCGKCNNEFRHEYGWECVWKSKDFPDIKPRLYFCCDCVTDPKDVEGLVQRITEVNRDNPPKISCAVYRPIDLCVNYENLQIPKASAFD